MIISTHESSPRLLVSLYWTHFNFLYTAVVSEPFLVTMYASHATLFPIKKNEKRFVFCAEVGGPYIASNERGDCSFQESRDVKTWYGFERDVGGFLPLRPTPLSSQVPFALDIAWLVRGLIFWEVLHRLSWRYGYVWFPFSRCCG